jgi:hypothetical protein
MSDQDRFADVMRQERQRLQQEREAIFNQQRELENKLTAIDREMAAIEAYEAAKTGKQAAAGRQTRGGGGRTRARRGSKREQLLELIRQNPDGLARKDILEKMGLKGDKSGEMSVSNALTALTKTNQVARHEGRYRSA